MMYGMFGFGWLMMLLVIGLPVLLIVLVLVGSAGFLQNWGRSSTTVQNTAPIYLSTVNPGPTLPAPTRYCSHCGAGLQTDWTHCPQCGAPIN
jgi:hypothetical protein